ncbi:MAG TPA: anthranilate phosphoribosyltransferase [Solirubrobacterales bacterium]|nr:anthranilate phosphoribosyltransferase [Solirubrobacterales bacterium]
MPDAAAPVPSEVLAAALRRLAGGEDLSAEEAEAIGHELARGRFTPVQFGALAAALRVKGETPAELHGLVRAYREHQTPVTLSAGATAIDVCGTGGDGASADVFNVSTCTAFVVAGAGVAVAKHGTSAVSSPSGSSDVLGVLGVDLELDAEGADALLREAGICYMHGPRFSPAMRHVIGLRRELGFRSVFNLVGPLTNPARVRHQLCGIYDRRYGGLAAEAMGLGGASRAWVLATEDGFDEVSLWSTTHVAQWADGGLSTFALTAADFGLPAAPPAAVSGGSPEENAATIEGILGGEVRGPRRDIVLANAAAALAAAGAHTDLREAAAAAAESIDSGAAGACLERLRSWSGA